jgi:hypothetical protein
MFRRGLLLATLAVAAWMAAAPTLAQELGPMALLGVNSALEGTDGGGAPAAAPPAAPGDPAPARSGACALTDDQIKEKLHAGGKKRALVIRGGKYGVAPYALSIIRRAAEACSFDPAVKKFLEDHLSRQYISDDAEVVARLEAMGYEVKRFTSAEYANAQARFKPDVLAELRKPETAVLVFYGHGNPDHFWLLDERENNVPGLDEMIRDKRLKHPAEAISVDDLHGAVKDRGGLDALILHGCQNGTSSYRRERGIEQGQGVTFSECVKKGQGFFGGWVTFSVYLHAETLPILERFFCHFASFDAAKPEASKDSGRYWMRSGGIGRKMSEIAFCGDGSGSAEADLAKDPQIVVHMMDYVAKVEPVRLFIEMLHKVKIDAAPLPAVLTDYLVAQYRYAEKNRVPMRQPGRGEPPALSATPTTAEINALLAYHGGPVLSEILHTVAPGLVFLEKESIRIDEGDKERLYIDLRFSLKNAQEIQRVLAQLQKANDYATREKLNAGVGEHLGNQLADNIGKAIKRANEALVDTIAKVNLQMSLEKSAKLDGDGKVSCYTLKPWVRRYHIAVGDVPADLAKGGTSPYEIHVSTKAIDTFVRKTLKNLFPGEIELKYDPGALAPNLYAYLSMRHDYQGPVYAIRDGLATTSLWQFRVNWFRIRDGYAYGKTTTSVRFKAAGGLKVSLDPDVDLWLTDGWGPISFAKGALSRYATDAINKDIKAKTAAGIDFADYVPAEFKNDVAGVVEIKDIKVRADAVSIYIDHVKK